MNLSATTRHANKFSRPVVFSSSWRQDPTVLPGGGQDITVLPGLSSSTDGDFKSIRSAFAVLAATARVHYKATDRELYDQLLNCMGNTAEELKRLAASAEKEKKKKESGTS